MTSAKLAGKDVIIKYKNSVEEYVELEAKWQPIEDYIELEAKWEPMKSTTSTSTYVKFNFSIPEISSNISKKNTDWGIRTSAWHGAPVAIGSPFVNHSIIPIDVLPIRFHDCIIMPISKKILRGATEESLGFINGMSDEDLAGFADTSLGYAPKLRGQLLDKLGYMREVINSTEIAPGFYRDDQGMVFIMGPICRFRTPQKKSKLRDVLERLPVAGSSIISLRGGMVINGNVVPELSKGVKRSYQYLHTSVVSDIISNSAQKTPVVLLYEASSGTANYVAKRIKDMADAKKELSTILEVGKSFSDVYIIIMSDGKPTVIGPIDESTDPSFITDLTGETKKHPHTLQDKHYNWAMRELRRLVDKIGPVRFISYTDSKKIGVANMRDMIALAKETGSTFKIWTAGWYSKGYTSYADAEYYKQYKKHIGQGLGLYRQLPSRIILGSLDESIRTVAHLIPEKMYTVGLTTKSLTPGTALMGFFASEDVYIHDKDAPVDEDRLVAGGTKIVQGYNAVGILTDNVPSDIGVYRRVRQHDEVGPHHPVIHLKKSASELLAKI